jgi:hypothetical protein
LGVFLLGGGQFAEFDQQLGPVVQGIAPVVVGSNIVRGAAQGFIVGGDGLPVTLPRQLVFGQLG